MRQKDCARFTRSNGKPDPNSATQSPVKASLQSDRLVMSCPVEPGSPNLVDRLMFADAESNRHAQTDLKVVDTLHRFDKFL